VEVNVKETKKVDKLVYLGSGEKWQDPKLDKLKNWKGFRMLSFSLSFGVCYGTKM
jgi:hypothetical protein